MGAINNEGDIERGVFELGSNNTEDNPYYDVTAPNGGFNRASGKGLAGNDDYQFLLWLDGQAKKGLSGRALQKLKYDRSKASGYWNIFSKDEAEKLHEMSFYGKSVDMINKYAITAPISSAYMTQIENDVRRDVTTGRLGGSKMNNKYLPGSDTKAYLNASQNFENEVLLRMAYRYNIDVPKDYFDRLGRLKSTEERDMGIKPSYEQDFKGEVYRAHVYTTMGSGKGKELDRKAQDSYNAQLSRAKEQKKAKAPYPYNKEFYKSLGITANNWDEYIRDMQKEGPAKYSFNKFKDFINVDQRDVEKKFNNVYPASSLREFVKNNMPNNVVGWAVSNYYDPGILLTYNSNNYTQTSNTYDNPLISTDHLRGEDARGYGPAMFMSRMIDNAKVWRENDFDAVYGKDVWKKSTDGGAEDLSVAVKTFYEDVFPQELKDIKSDDPLMDYKSYFYGDAGKDIFENDLIEHYSYLDNDFGVNKMSNRAISGAFNDANAFFAKNIDTIDTIGSVTNTMNFIKDTVGNFGEAVLGGVDSVINFGEDIIHGENIAKSTGNLFFKMGEELIWDPIEQTYYDAKEWNDKQQKLLEYDPGSVVIPEPGSNADSPFDDTDTGNVDQSGDNINEDGTTSSGGGSSTGSGGGAVATGVAGGVLENLRRMLGIQGSLNDGKEIIDELVNPGGELPKLADSMFRPEQRDAEGNITQQGFGMQDLMSQQAQVAEQGYDIGEREALSAKARRELAGLARQQGMAAGAASGGVRGASTAAQARSLMEKAMMKQADVTTEMDKAAISRKDSARQQLANLAQGVYGFDISREEDARKRRSATVLGIENLQQQAANAAAQLKLAESD